MTTPWQLPGTYSGLHLYVVRLQLDRIQRSHREVFDALRHERQIAYTTVMTTMVRLSEKGLLKIVDKVGLANCYMPAYDREEFIATAVKMVLEIFSSQFPRESQEFFEGYQAKLARKAQRKK